MLWIKATFSNTTEDYDWIEAMIGLVTAVIAVLIVVLFGTIIPLCVNDPDTAREPVIVISLYPPSETILFIVFTKLYMVYTISIYLLISSRLYFQNAYRYQIIP